MSKWSKRGVTYGHFDVTLSGLQFEPISSAILSLLSKPASPSYPPSFRLITMDPPPPATLTEAASDVAQVQGPTLTRRNSSSQQSDGSQTAAE